MSTDVTYVYVIAHISANKPKAPVKIGISSKPDGRLRNLQTANPKSLVLLATLMCPTRPLAKTLEGAFHEVMSSKRLSGEWFDVAPIDAVQAMCDNFRACFNRFLADDPAVMAEALARSNVLSTEASLAAWRAHGAMHLNDNSDGVIN